MVPPFHIFLLSFPHPHTVDPQIESSMRCELPDLLSMPTAQNRLQRNCEARLANHLTFSLYFTPLINNSYSLALTPRQASGLVELYFWTYHYLILDTLSNISFKFPQLP